MNKYPCKLIQDLMPLYVDKDISNESKEIVEQHLVECEDCRLLMKSYSGDELNLDNYQEDLPKADKFKRFMKRIKKWAGVGIVIILIVAIAITSLGYNMGKKSVNDIISLKTIVNTLKKGGVVLKKDNSQPSDKFQLNGVNPAIYTIGKTKDKLLIYIFRSFVERKSVAEKAHTDISKSEYNRYFNVENAYIIYIPYETPKDGAETKSASKTQDLIYDIIFKNINGGKEITYKGESASWEGSVTLKYYEHWWKDEKGVLQYEDYCYRTPIIKYKLSNPSEVGQIKFEFKTDGEAGSRTGLTLKGDNFVDVGFSGDTDKIPHAKDTYEFTITWNGKEEKLTLKAK